MVFEILKKDGKSRARVGLLKTKSGEIETPFFMPVATKASTKQNDTTDLESMGARAIISNAYILSLKPGEKLIKKMGGIGKFMNYPGIIFTDSGGFQMYTKSLFIKSEDRGVTFKNPFTGEKTFISPEDNMKIQLHLNSDVAMCLDSMPLYGEKKESIKEAVRKTALWAERCKKEHDKLHGKKRKEKRQMLFGIIQGGVYDDLRETSAMMMSRIDFDGFSIGGLALGEPLKDELRMVEIAKRYIPEEKPVYLMGAGEPVELLEAIERGVDIFDSRYPTMNARRSTLFTWKGKVRISNLKYKYDASSIDKDCDCFVCKKYSKAYVQHLLWHDSWNGFRLACYHNLYFMQRLMERAREEIKKGTFQSFKRKFIRAWS